MLKMRSRVVLAALAVAVLSLDAQFALAQEGVTNNNASEDTIQALKKRNIMKRKRRMQEVGTTATKEAKAPKPAKTESGATATTSTQ